MGQKMIKNINNLFKHQFQCFRIKFCAKLMSRNDHIDVLIGKYYDRDN
jgi:hypothetical protein